MKQVSLSVCVFLIIGMVNPATADDCDRQCLISIMDRYITALVRHDPTMVPLHRDVRFVENTEKTAIGAGFWKTISRGPKDFKIYAADPVVAQVGLIGVMQENDLPVLVAIRLKVVDGKITEIDHLVHHETRQPLARTLITPRPALVQPLKESERSSREQMFKIANSYYDSIVQADGTVAPFADECVRRENGMTTANDREPPAKDDDFAPFRKMSCAEQMSTGVWKSITSVDQRRLLVADVEMGLVFAFSMLVHNGKPEVIEIVGVPGVTEWPNKYGAFDLVAAHMFKIRNGKIHEIEALGYMGKHGVKNGWE